tara:strand:+ start:48 stop:368 length:321 start_codon:yes stop_codon:yes gene_type:complete
MVDMCVAIVQSEEKKGSLLSSILFVIENCISIILIQSNPFHEINKRYSPRSSPPVNVTVMGHTFLSASGSSSGGAAVAGILLFMEGFSSPLVSQGLEYVIVRGLHV